MSFIQITRVRCTKIISVFLLSSFSVSSIAEVRHCQAEWLAVNKNTGETAYLEAFESAGGCSKFKPNDCREKAKNYAVACIKAHWDKRWDGVKPKECTRSEIKGYDMTNMKALLEGAACYYDWDTSGGELKLIANIKGDNRCSWSSVISPDYKVTSNTCKNVTARPVKKYISNAAFKIPDNDAMEPRTGLRFPKAMPKVRFPKGYKGCNGRDKQRIDRSWAMATYMTWIGDKAMDWMHDNGKYRKAAWDHNYQSPNETNQWTNYAARGWFGAFNNENFSVADNAIERLWRDRIQGKTFTVQCRAKGKSGSHPCFTSNPGGKGRPSANHIVYGKINFCNSALSNSNVYSAARNTIHELLHWQRTKTGRFISDSHTHCHGIGRCTNEKAYGPEKSAHLANYGGGKRGTKAGQRRRHAKHRDKALHNNDNYSNYLYNFGRMAHIRGEMDGLEAFYQFPAGDFKW